jgi:peptide/nickel transport system permease protein
MTLPSVSTGSDQLTAVQGAPLSPPPVRRRLSSLGPEAVFRRAPRFKGRFLLWVALTWIGLVAFGAIFANLLPLKPYDAIVNGLPVRTAPGLRAQFLGTDLIGRSVLSRVVFGARESLLVGIIAVAIAMAAGLVIGISAGFFRGKIDEVIGVVVDSALAIPALVLLLAFASVGKRDLTTLIAGLAIVGTPSFARLARANTLSLADRDYVTAARLMGSTRVRIMGRELLPEVVLRLSSFAFLFMAYVIVAEGSLSFLGLGIPPPSPSWGGMINDARPYLETQSYLVWIPAACLFFTVVAFTVVGDHVRRHFDTRESALG